MKKTEVEKGRIAVWLDPDDVKFIANEWRKIPKDISDVNKETWGRIAFRCMTALHKLGIEYKPEFPNDNERYCLSK
ncbi:MAG: hypothetical protein KGV44_11865 [Flavobacteriaceae bacterium]|nr:hypothetical protein [Flavobacteriaceae bacterium]